MSRWFFSSWQDVLRVLVVGVLTYVSLVVILRISGKRTLSKMNAFDFVITIALGSSVASILLSRDVTLAQGLTALVLLVSLQFLVTFTSVRSSAFGDLLKARPTLLYYRGQFLRRSMKQERVHEHEILAAVRESGISSLQQVDAVVLETQGELSVLTRGEHAPDTLRGIADPPAEIQGPASGRS